MRETPSLRFNIVEGIIIMMAVNDLRQEDWDAFIQYFLEHKAHIRGVLVIELKNKKPPNSYQREQAVQAEKGMKIKRAFLSDSTVSFAVMKVFSWLNADFGVFRHAQIREAIAHLGMSAVADKIVVAVNLMKPEPLQATG